MKSKWLKAAILLAVPIVLALATVPVAHRHQERLYTRALIKELMTSNMPPARLQELVVKGADVNGRLEDGSTPLYIAATRNDVTSVQGLLTSVAGLARRSEAGK